MAYRSLPDFNPDANYQVARAITLNGVALAEGDPIPQSVPIRRVRQLYEMRKVRPMTAVAPQPVIDEKSKHRKVKHG